MRITWATPWNLIFTLIMTHTIPWPPSGPHPLRRKGPNTPDSIKSPLSNQLYTCVHKNLLTYPPTHTHAQNGNSQKIIDTSLTRVFVIDMYLLVSKTCKQMTNKQLSIACVFHVLSRSCAPLFWHKQTKRIPCFTSCARRAIARRGLSSCEMMWAPRNTWASFTTTPLVTSHDSLVSHDNSRYLIVVDGPQKWNCYFQWNVICSLIRPSQVLSVPNFTKSFSARDLLKSLIVAILPPSVKHKAHNSYNAWLLKMGK